MMSLLLEMQPEAQTQECSCLIHACWEGISFTNNITVRETSSIVLSFVYMSHVKDIYV